MSETEEQVVNTETADESTATTEATTEENNSSQAEESEEQSTEESQQQETEESEESEGEKSEEETESEETETDKPKKGADARKEQLNGQIDDANREIRDLNEHKKNIFAQRDAVRRDVEKINSEHYKPATTDELVKQENPDTGDYYTQLEAQVESMRQEREVDKYNNQVVDARLGMQVESQQAVKDFPMFDEKNTAEYQPEVAKAVNEIIDEALIVDPKTKQVIGTHLSVYKLCQAVALASKTNARNADIKAQRNVEKQLTNVDRTPGGKGKAKAFADMSHTEKAAYLRKKGHDV